MKHTLKEIVKNTTAKMAYVCNGMVYYVIVVDGTFYQLEIDTIDKVEFNNVYFYPEMKAIQLMRIKKLLKSCKPL